MARSRTKKKTIPQKIVGFTTAGLPRPIRGLLGHRVVSSLIVFAPLVLVLTGIVVVDWDGGRPKLSIDKDRAAEVKENLTEAKEKVVREIRALRAGESVDGPPLDDFVPAIGHDRNDSKVELPDWMQFEEATDRIADRVTEVSERLEQAHEQASDATEKDTASKGRIRPLFQLR